MFKSKSSMIIVSLLVAIAVWLYVMGEVDPETSAKITDIPVNFTNTEILAEYGLAVACDEKQTITASISGKRSDVNSVKSNGLVAAVDVADFEQGDNTGKITINVPDGVSIKSASATTMTVKVEEIVYEYKPVAIVFSESETSGDPVIEEIPWVLDHYPSEISVSGAKSSVAKIDKLLGVIDPDEAVKGENRTVRVELIPVDKKGREILNVTLYQDHADVEIRMLTSVSAELELTTDDDVDFDKLGIPDNIRIAGPKSMVKDIKKVKGVATSYDDKVYIDTDLPEGVILVLGEENGKIIWN